MIVNNVSDWVRQLRWSPVVLVCPDLGPFNTLSHLESSGCSR